jgi:hypothetical protein
MRILSATTGHVQISSLTDEPERMIRSQEISRSLITADNAYLVLVCIEVGDDVPITKKMASRIMHQWNEVKERYSKIVFVPFGHLSSTPHSSKSKTAFLIDKLYRIIRNNGVEASCVETNQANFIFSKLLIFDNGNSVRFSSSEYGLKQIVKEILASYGTTQVLATLAEMITKKDAQQ